MLFTDRNVFVLALARSRSASATLLSSSFSTRRCFIGAASLDAAPPISSERDHSPRPETNWRGVNGVICIKNGGSHVVYLKAAAAAQTDDSCAALAWWN